jgi:hypothetical protein
VDCFDVTRVNCFLTKQCCRFMSKGLLLAGWLMFRQWTWWYDLDLPVPWRWRNVNICFIVMPVLLTGSKPRSWRFHVTCADYIFDVYRNWSPVECGSADDCVWSKMWKNLGCWLLLVLIAVESWLYPSCSAGALRMITLSTPLCQHLLLL